MIKSIEATGKTKDDAIQNALRELGLTMDDISYEILDIGRAGFFGIGAVPAKVKVSYEVPDEPKPEVKAEKPAEKPAEKREKPEKKEKPKTEKPRAEKPKTEKPKAEKAKKVLEGEKNKKTAQVETFLKGLFERMGVDAEAQAVYSAEDSTITVELTGSKVGALIGRRGETLDAIQHLTNYVINNGENERTRVNVDAENYRAKRADALSGLAKKTAVKVVKYRRNMTLEPMNAYERHVIHTALQDFDGVTTYSTGTEPNRRVVVAYDRPQRESSGYDRRQSRRERPQRSSAPAAAAETDAPAEEKPAPVEAPKPEKKPTREWC